MPRVFFGKGFGDLPDSADYLKPFAITGVLGIGLPAIIQMMKATLIRSIMVLRYSIPYLQQHVKDVGIPAPLNRVIPIVEFNFEKPLNCVDDKDTTGTLSGLESPVSLDWKRCCH